MIYIFRTSYAEIETYMAGMAVQNEEFLLNDFAI